MNPQKNSFLTAVVCIVMGALLATAFAPINWYPFAIISPAVLLYIWLNTPHRRHAFWYGFFFGVGFFGLGVSWIYISMKVYGQAPLPLAFLLTLAVICYNALFIAPVGFILACLPTKRPLVKSLLAFPVIWIAFEWLRGWLFTGFPWLWLGYSQVNTPLAGFAPLLSVYGVGWVTLLASALLVSVLIAQHLWSKVVCFCSLIGLWGLGLAVHSLVWTYPTGKPLIISLVQGNIPQQQKWEPNELATIIQTYEKLSDPHWGKSDLIVWPEAAIPVTIENASLDINSLDQRARANNTAFFTGILLDNPYTQQIFNGLLSLGPNQAEYHKRHLVPFGEFFPGKYVLHWFYQFFQIPMADLSAGAEIQGLLSAKGAMIAPYICYEIAFPEEIFSTMQNANILLTVSDDSWFGRSLALGQHLQIAQMRALETGRPSLFVTNTGITAFINRKGEISQQLPEGKAGVLTDVIQPMAGNTPIMHTGFIPFIIFQALLLLIALVL